MKKQKVRIINGEELAYIEKGSGNKNLIMIHGMYFTSKYFETLIEELKNDFKIYALDLRGFGDSSYYREVKNTGNFAKDLMHFIESLNIEKPIILGWGLGAGVALDFAARFTKVADKLILINSIPHKGLPVFKRDENDKILIGHVFETKEEMFKDNLKHDQYMKFINSGDMDNFKEIVKEISTKNKIEKSWIKDSMKQKNISELNWVLSHFNLSGTHNFYTPGIQTINRIRIPSLHIWSTDDKLIKEHMVKANYLAMKDQAEYISYKNLGHAPFIDEPERVATDIIKFSKNKTL